MKEHADNDLEVFEDLESEVRSYVRSFPTVFERAKGSRMYDEGGKSYLDFFSGAGALNYGHNDDRMQNALVEYVKSDGITHSLDMASAAKRRFIERFEEVILRPRGLEYRFLFPGPTGTNAVEAALKDARKATGRKMVYGFKGAFHGMTLGALAITSNPMKRAGAGQPLPYAKLLPFEGETDDAGRDSLAALRHQLEEAQKSDELPAAVVLETIQCEGGVRTASAEWLRQVEATCCDFGVLMIVDDIQAGCGRTGRFFSFEEAGIKPAMVCLSKSLSGMGVPFALVLVRAELDVFKPGEHNGTFRGHNLAFVTAAAALDYWADPAFEQGVRAKGELLGQRLQEIVEKAGVPAEIRGRGMVRGIAFEDHELAGAIAAACFEHGLIIETAGHEDEVLKFLPALTIDEAALREGLETVERCTLEVVKRHAAGTATV